MRRYDPPYVAARSRIEAGEIGQVVVFKSIGRDRNLTRRRLPGGGQRHAVPRFHRHDFDLARWLTGDEIVEVHAFGSTVAIRNLERWMPSDAGVVNLQFAPAPSGNIESFWTRSMVTIFALRSLALKAHSSWTTAARLHSW
jgi:predicted dehydrogenase